MYIHQDWCGSTWWRHLCAMCQSVHSKQSCRAAVASSVHTFNCFFWWFDSFNQLGVCRHEKQGNMVWLTKMGAGEGFVAARNVCVNMVQVCFVQINSYNKNIILLFCHVTADEPHDMLIFLWCIFWICIWGNINSSNKNTGEFSGQIVWLTS